MPNKLKRYQDWLGAKLTDPDRVARYLNTASDDSEAMFLKALRKVALAQNRSMTEIAESSGISRESLYRMLSETGNPTSENRRAILAALGFKSIVVPLNEGSAPQFKGSEVAENDGSVVPESPQESSSKGVQHFHALYHQANMLGAGTPGNMNLGIAVVNYPVPSVEMALLAMGTFSVLASTYLHRMADTPEIPKGTMRYLTADALPTVGLQMELQHVGR